MNGSETEDAEHIVQKLNEIEMTEWTWFRQSDPQYPLDKVTTVQLAERTKEAEKAGVQFAPNEVQAFVKQYSPTVYGLLMQYALRAQKLGIDMNDPRLRYKLAGKSR
ncbi:hypothetical protein D3C85_1621250 [compost metagenome]